MRTFTLGGAQFSDSYGKYVPVEKLASEEICHLLTIAKSSGIHKIDLALNYTNASRNLANSGMTAIFDFSTKIQFGSDHENQLVDQIVEELILLNRNSFETVFIHNWFQLDNEARRKSLDLISRMKADGLARQIGISIYDESELEGLDNSISIIQAPLNFYNTQFVYSEKTRVLKERGVIFQARSIFHQGILLNPTMELKERYPDLSYFLEYCKRNRSTYLEACFEIFDNQSIFSELVIGVADTVQLKQILDTSLKKSSIYQELEGLEFSSMFSDPRKWN